MSMDLIKGWGVAAGRGTAKFRTTVRRGGDRLQGKQT